MEWKLRFYREFVPSATYLGNFLSGMETIDFICEGPCLAPPLETSLVEWKRGGAHLRHVGVAALGNFLSGMETCAGR